jgi:hypothetical protein
VFLATLGADEAQIQACFRAAISTARQRKSVFAEKRAEAAYAEYRRQEASASGGIDFDYLFGNLLSRPDFFNATTRDRLCTARDPSFACNFLRTGK